MSDILGMYSYIREDAAVKELFEVNWKQALGTAVVAGSLMFGNNMVANADAKPTIVQQKVQIDMPKLLHALKQVESSGGTDKRDRYEPKFEEKYLIDNDSNLGSRTKAAIAKYGTKQVATSYGPYQIMAATAYDRGFAGKPEDLRNESTCKTYAEKYINWLLNRPKVKTLEDVISAYNAGAGGVGTNPDYVSKVMKHYK